VNLKNVLYLKIQIEALPEIVKAVDDRVEVYLDGGITQGTDVFKALALGARMVTHFDLFIIRK